ncbi:hypothetical protein [Thalassiella azotivora]
MIKTALLSATSTALTLALLGTGMSPTEAKETFPDQTAGFISQVAPDQGDVVGAFDGSSAVTDETDQVVRTAPVDPTQAVTAATPDGGAPFSISLPKEVELHPGKVAADSTVVYRARDGRADAAVQLLEDGSTRMQTVIRTASAPHTFTYAFTSGYRPMDAPDGQLVLANDMGDVVVFDEPWVRDARGRDVATHYEVHEGTIVQVIDADEDVRYPLVADPRWKWWKLAYHAKFNRTETQTLASAGGVAAMCGILGLYAPPLAAICGAYGGYIFAQANIANAAKQCISVTAAPPGLVFRYKDQDCF